jgi:hypothetical protein
MNSFKHWTVTAIFAALACTGLHAQTTDMWAAVPFDFHAGDKLIPAGEYVIHQQGSVVWLREANNGRPALAFVTVGTQGRGPARQARLDFDCYGSDYFLTTIWNSFSQDGRQVLPSSREKELAKRREAPVPATIAITSTK